MNNTLLVHLKYDLSYKLDLHLPFNNTFTVISEGLQKTTPPEFIWITKEESFVGVTE